MPKNLKNQLAETFSAADFEIPELFTESSDKDPSGGIVAWYTESLHKKFQPDLTANENDIAV
jgi:hypothetical protein